MSSHIETMTPAQITERLKTDSDLRITFNAVTTGSMALSGWDVVRASRLEPLKVKVALDTAVASGVMQTSGVGLDGYYAPTGLAFEVKSCLPSVD